MRQLWLVLSTTLILAAAAYSDEAKGTDDAKQIRGHWKATAAERSGLPAPDEVLPRLKVAITAETIGIQDGRRTETTGYRLKPSTSPKQIDLVLTAGPAKGKTIQGIYELKGDDLKLCWSKAENDRPKEFATQKGSDQVLFVLKRGWCPTIAERPDG